MTKEKNTHISIMTNKRNQKFSHTYTQYQITKLQTTMTHTIAHTHKFTQKHTHKNTHTNTLVKYKRTNANINLRTHVDTPLRIHTLTHAKTKKLSHTHPETPRKLTYVLKRTQ